MEPDHDSSNVDVQHGDQQQVNKNFEYYDDEDEGIVFTVPARAHVDIGLYTLLLNFSLLFTSQCFVAFVLTRTHTPGARLGAINTDFNESEFRRHA